MQASIYELLKADHKTVDSLFDAMEASEDAGARTGLVARLKHELLAHAEAEKKRIQAALRAAA